MEENNENKELWNATKQQLEPHQGKERGIIIVGSGSIGKALSNRTERLPALMVSDNSININGEKWEEIPKPEPVNKGSKAESKTLSSILAASQMYIYAYQAHNELYSERPQVKTISYPTEYLMSEYAKIQRKESDLPRSKRDEIVRVFEQNFRRKTNETT